MRVGLNLLFLVPGETGGSEIYARELVPALLAAGDDIEYTLILSREAFESFSSETWASSADLVRVPVSGRSRLMRVAAEQLILPLIARRRSLDVIHSLATTAPAVTGAANVVTILDVIYKHVPEAHGGAARLGMRTLVPLSARRADRVIAISKATRDDLVKILHVAEDKIDVVYLAASQERAEATPAAELRRRFGLTDGPLVLSVSAKRPHKNLMRLITALHQVEHTPKPLLVLPGYPTAHEKELENHARDLGVGDRVRFLGWLDDRDLEGLYKLATCFVFPSLVEGFGLPVVEAMARGVPVACSNAAPMPEIAGEAARYFDPTDVDSMSAAMRKILGSSAERERLSRLGIERAARYSWSKAAEETLASYRRAMS